MKISPARIAAFEILTKIEREKSFSSVLLPIYEEKLEAKDRALCHALTLGVLRKQIYLDRLIERLTNGKKLDSAVKIILRVGLYQLIYLDKIPAHAAINDAVNQVQAAKKTSAKGLVNAALRRFTREQPMQLRFSDDIEHIAVETSHPRWIIERWIDQFGFEEASKLAEENNKTPHSVFRLTNRSDENTAVILKKFGLEIVESEIVENAWEVSGTNEMLRLYAEEGKIYFQDEGSQLVGQTVDLKEKEKFLDVCSAPGSKVTQISKIKFKFSNLIVAGDFYEHRVKILRENCQKQAANFVKIVRYDAGKSLPFADESFDVVLVDAPCSGTGTIRHNPEIRYFLHETDFAELSVKQLGILENASKLVKYGGRIIYSTCSLEREENEAVVENFAAENKEFHRIKPKCAEKFLTASGYARTFPQTHQTDGFFVAVFEKKRVFDKV
jgi:16S rRNA (cytosine967-C5)-methyltransferase